MKPAAAPEKANKKHSPGKFTSVYSANFLVPSTALICR